MMTTDENFLEELLAEAEAKEEQCTEAYFDLLLLQIQQQQDQIERNFTEAEKEVQMIKEWVLRRNHALHEKVTWLEKKLEAFIRERKVKTIELPHGTLKVHKKPDRCEITDPELFLRHAKPELLSVIPEQLKPDLTKIKAYIKTHYNALPGVQVIPGREEFSYKLRKEDSYGGEKEAGTAAEPAFQNRTAV